MGSNTFNILGYLGLSGVRAGGGSGHACPLSVGPQNRTVGGGVFLGCYTAYVTYLIMAAQAHDALPTYSSVRVGFVNPLTVVTWVVSLIRKSAATAPKDWLKIHVK